MGDHQANPKREPRVQDPIDDQGFIAALQDASLQDASLQLHLVPSPARSQEASAEGNLKKAIQYDKSWRITDLTPLHSKHRQLYSQKLEIKHLAFRIKIFQGSLKTPLEASSMSGDRRLQHCRHLRATGQLCWRPVILFDVKRYVLKQFKQMCRHVL